MLCLRKHFEDGNIIFPVDEKLQFTLNYVKHIKKLTVHGDLYP